MREPRGMWLPALAWLLACWPLLGWFTERAGATDDLAAGVMAVGAVVLFSLRTTRNNSGARARGSWWPAVLSMVVFAASQPFLPMTLRGLPAVAALLLAPGPWRRGRWPDPAVTGLLLLALPTTMMLELFLGYPLRLMASVFAETILHGAGLPVSRDSVEIVWAGRPVWVDAPCSGIRMLWGGVWLALIATGLHRLNGWRTSIAVVLAVVVVTLANMLRVTALCLSSVTLLPPGEPLHTGMGVAAFATGTLLIVWFVRILSRRSAIPLAARPHKADPTRTAGRTAFLLACLAAAAIQLLPKPTSAMSVQGFRFPGWPATFEGRRLRATPLTPQETAFNTSFPGRIARFEDGTRVIIWRWITQPTHRVHSAMNCLHSSGWHVTPQPMHHDAAGGTWSCFLAERRDVRLRVREQCTDSSGGIWPDVPAWFWAAWMGHSTGPWQVVTVAERVQN